MDWLIYRYRRRAGEYAAVELGHIAEFFLDLEDNSIGSAIARDQVTANAMVQVPSDVYARMMEGGIYLLGYHTWDG